MGEAAPDDPSAPRACWPAPLRGVTESVVTTLGPDERWNLAALGLEVAPDRSEEGDDGEAQGGTAAGAAGDAPVVTARTWGRTRTRRNFAARGEGYVQFTPDPVAFVDAALGIREVDEPVLESAAAWARVAVERVEEGTSGGTDWVDWRLRPVESVVREESIPVVNRGYNALVEATVVASRLEVPAYDRDVLETRLDALLDVVERCGGPREQTARGRFEELVDR